MKQHILANLRQYDLSRIVGWGLAWAYMEPTARERDVTALAPITNERQQLLIQFGRGYCGLSFTGDYGTKHYEMGKFYAGKLPWADQSYEGALAKWCKHWNKVAVPLTNIDYIGLVHRAASVHTTDIRPDIFFPWFLRRLMNFNKEVRSRDIEWSIIDM